MSTNTAKPEATPEAKATTRATGRETATLYSAMTPRLSPPMPLRKTKRLRATNLPLRSLQQSQLWMRSLQQSKLQVWAVRSISRISFSTISFSRRLLLIVTLAIYLCPRVRQTTSIPTIPVLVECSDLGLSLISQQHFTCTLQPQNYSLHVLSFDPFTL